MTLKALVKQGEKTAFKMAENNSKWSNWQTTDLKNIQATYAGQFQVLVIVTNSFMNVGIHIHIFSKPSFQLFGLCTQKWNW